jgi:hypothetical protein
MSKVKNASGFCVLDLYRPIICMYKYAGAAYGMPHHMINMVLERQWRQGAYF